MALSIAIGSALLAPATVVADDSFPENRRLLADDTQAVFEVTNVPRMNERWDRTFLGAICDDPEMEPFFDSQRETLRDRLSEAGFAVNLTLRDIQEIASGEASLAWLQMPAQTAVCVLVDTRDRDQQTREVLARIDADLKRERGATVRTESHDGHAITVYTLKKKIGQIKVDQVCYARVDGRLIGSDRPEVVKSLIDRRSGTGNFSSAKDYGAVHKKISDGKDDDMRWFVRPLGFARVLEERGGGLKKQQLDTIQLLQQQGFDAILAAGGNIRLDADKYDLRHKSYIYAPPTTDLPSKYRLAGRMLQFPNEVEHDPPGWVLPSAASFLHGNWKMEEAFWAAETLVNQAVGDEIFRRVVDGIKKDKDGPQIDIAADIIANFKEEIVMLTDNTQPVTTKSERMLIGVALNNATIVKKAVDKAMKSDPNAIEYEFPPHDWIWQVTQPDVSEDEIELEGFEDFEDFIDDGQPKEDPLLNQWAITVYDDWLMFSSHAEMLADTIEHLRSGGVPAFAADPDFQRMRETLKKETGAERSVWRVLRTRLAFRAKFELFRRGELRDSDSVLAAIIRRLFQDEEHGEDGKLELDVSQLPEFGVIEKHLQPSGTSIKTEDEGWTIRGMMLRPDDSPIKAAAASPKSR